jgi:hypothetical protein
LNANKAGFSELYQRTNWDTSDFYGPIGVNGLAVSLGHTFDPDPKENAATFAEVHGANDEITQEIELTNTSPSWAARHPIIALHFLGVAA